MASAVVEAASSSVLSTGTVKTAALSRKNRSPEAQLSHERIKLQLLRAAAEAAQNMAQRQKVVLDGYASDCARTAATGGVFPMCPDTMHC